MTEETENKEKGNIERTKAEKKKLSESPEGKPESKTQQVIKQKEDKKIPKRFYVYRNYHFNPTNKNHSK